MDLNGKSILLTNYSLGEYAGSEINCLSLAEALEAMGADVEIATFNFALPISEDFKKVGLRVRNVFFDPLDRDRYDLIWAHHAPVLDHLLFSMGVSAGKILFSSLSPLEALEGAPAYARELSWFLANSRETRARLLSEAVPAERCTVFPNYVPERMARTCRTAHRPSLTRAAIVSNHIPAELEQAAAELTSKGVQTDCYGKGHRVTLITEETLRPYDAVITIGKTVQYAMALGIPVYCYDQYGGPGWIGEEDLEQAYSRNFSGRGFQTKTAEQIVSELTEGYPGACTRTAALRRFTLENCLLETNLESVFSLLADAPETDAERIREAYSYKVRESQTLVRLYRYNLYREMRLIDMEQSITAVLEKYEKIVQEKADQQIEFERQLTRERSEGREEQARLTALLEQEKAASRQALQEADEARRELEEKLGDLSGELARCRQELSAKSAELSARTTELSARNTELSLAEQRCAALAETAESRRRELYDIIYSRAWRLILFYRRIKDTLLGRRKWKEFTPPRTDLLPPPTPEKQPEKTRPDVPLVTVGIPVYDRTDYLIASIESILSQTYPNVEIIAVCDGSPKETLEIIRKYEREGKIRAYYYPDNSGNAVRGRNKAIREAKGVYYAFQDSDDIAAPTRIADSVEYLEKYGADVVYGGWRALVDGSRAIDIENGQEVFSPDCDYDMLLTTCVPCQSTVMAKTEKLRQLGGLKTSMRYREDHELWLRMAYYGCRFKAVDRILTNLRLHEGNLELSFRDSDAKWFELMLEQHKTIIPFKPKIAYVIPGCGISGGIAVICQHLNRLKKRGYDVLMITEDDNREISWFPRQEVPIVPVREAPDNVDVLVATGWTTAYTALALPAKEKFYFVQSDETRFVDRDSPDWQKARRTYTMDFRFLTEAKWIRDWLKKEFGKDAAYVPNGLDEEIVYCTEQREEVLNRKVRVLLEGPISIPYKGMRDAFAAVEGLDCEVWCVSSAGEPRPEWRCDRFFGQVPMESMKYIYSQCEILLKMSRVEGFFGPPMEMMACGGTCVVGKVTGYDEYIVNGWNALVVEQGDVRGAHDALKRLIEDPVYRKMLAANGQQTARQWRWEPSIDTLEELYSGKQQTN